MPIRTTEGASSKNHDLFEGEFGGGFDCEAGKVVEGARGEQAKRRPAKSGTNAANVETFNFRMGADPSSPKPTKKCAYVAGGQDVLRIGEDQSAPPPKPGKRFPEKVEPKASKPSKSFAGPGTSHSSKNSDGMKSALAHSDPVNGSPGKVAKAGRKTNHAATSSGGIAKSGAPVRVTDDPAVKPQKRVHGDGATYRGCAGIRTSPWTTGVDTPPKKADVEQRHKCAPPSARQLHSFEPPVDTPKVPGYSVSAPFGTDYNAE